uniref:Radical SAM superfamily protein n=1 Tax=viral metagenome TaxID=1070528 RepID=A0A6M3JFR9_9ZZZZ
MNNVKKSIGWADFTVNPVKGKCPVACPYCYARRLYDRFKWNPEIRYDPDAFNGLPSKPSRIFVGSTMELFGDWVERDWWHMIMAKCLSRPQHTFIFLTKQPQNLPKKFPDNCYIGVSVTSEVQLRPAIWKLNDVQCNKRFLSLEPLLEPVFNQVLPAEWDTDIDWIIIGQQTPIRKETTPKIEWIREIVEAADKAGIPVFLKDNLYPLIHYERRVKDRGWLKYYEIGENLRQEIPRCGY